MEQNPPFEALLNKHYIAVERYIHFRLPHSYDADDVIQETYIAAYLGFEKLRDKELFKPWILSIARNQCNLWFRKNQGDHLLPLDSLPETAAPCAQEDSNVLDILELLPEDTARLLKLTMDGYKQQEIAQMLQIPLGTVKSRMYAAKKQFRSVCTPLQLNQFEKGRNTMTRKDNTCGFPETIPTLIIKKSTRPFVPVKCADESFIIPIIGNRNAEGTYRYPTKKLALVSTCYVPKAALIHGVSGVKVCRDTYNIKAGKLYKK